MINPVIYTEVGAMVESIEELDRLLLPTLFRRDAVPWEASYIAGRALWQYHRQGKKRNRILADFSIGAHATQAGMKLVSRYQGQADYFKVIVIDPSEI